MSGSVSTIQIKEVNLLNAKQKRKIFIALFVTAVKETNIKLAKKKYKLQTFVTVCKLTTTCCGCQHPALHSVKEANEPNKWPRTKIKT